MGALLCEDHDNGRRRDLLRDFCLAAQCLEEQFRRFDVSGALSFAVITDLVGSQYNKGLLWQAKDSSRQLFDNKAQSPAAGQLDWAIGYLFHECRQLAEAACQLQQYGPRLASLGRMRSAEIEEKLLLVAGQSGDNLGRHIARARELISAVKTLFCLYLAGESANRPLARFIHDREPLLRDVFGCRYEQLLQSIYGRNPELLFLESALSLEELGQKDKALLALRKALEINPRNARCALLLERLRPEPGGLTPP